MAQTQIIQRRIRSVRNAGQITKALEVVAASRMRRIQESVTKIQRYAEVAESIMRRIAPNQEAKTNIYFNFGNSKAKLYLIFNSDRGQAGAFNSNIFSLAHNNFLRDIDQGFKPFVIAFGRKGSSHFSRLSNVELLGAYEDMPDVPQANAFASVLETITDGFSQNRFNSVQIIFTRFKSSLLQETSQKQLLPVSLVEDKTNDDVKQPPVYEFEPGIAAVLEEAIRIYFEASLMSSRIESAASEHSMRMMAMGNANRNARELVEDLTLELNSVRQAAITQEIAEITGGAEAITA